MHEIGWVITALPNELVVPIHGRMPDILPPIAWRAWLGEEAASEKEPWALLTIYPPALMPAYPVDIRLGNLRNNDAAADRAACAPPVWCHA